MTDRDRLIRGILIGLLLCLPVWAALAFIVWKWG